MIPVLPEGFDMFKAERIRIGEGYLSVILTRNAGSDITQFEIVENTTGFELKVEMDSINV